MRPFALTRTHLVLLFIAAFLPRFIGAFWLPNAFGDAYAYSEQIYYLRLALLDGSFSLSHLFGFWLPLYQMICAIISAIAGSPFVVPKVVSAVAGGGVCVLIYLLTSILTSSRWLSLTCSAIVVLNPYHILYSASAMTDVPHAFLILLCAYCCIRNRCLAACVCAVAAGLIRIESWTLIPIIPLAQLLSCQNSGFQKTDSAPSGVKFGWARFATPALQFFLLSAAPVLWLLVSWKATGDFWKYFEIRNTYIVETVSSSTWLAHFSVLRVAFDAARLLYTSNPLVLFASVAVVVTLLKSNHEARSNKNLSSSRFSGTLRNLLTTPQGLLLTFFYSHLSFLLVAYVTNNQPEIWPRYGLIFFTLGLPLLALRWSTAFVSASTHLRYVSVTVAIFSLQFCGQLVDVTRMVVKPDQNAIAAEFLAKQRHLDNTIKVYCEDGAIRVLSGIPLEEFRNQYNSPADDVTFLNALRENQVRFLVYKDLPGSRLKEIIARIRTRRNSNGITLEEINPSQPRKAGENVIVYRIHDIELAKGSKKSPMDKYRRR